MRPSRSYILAPGEAISSVAAVTTQIRKGLLKQPRRCVLLLTNRPRILCVLYEKDQDQERVPKQSDVKHTLELRPSGKKQGGVVAVRAEQRRLAIRTVRRHAPLCRW